MFRSRVVPAIGLTIARPRRTIRLKSVDLPTFTRPTSTTTGKPFAAIVIRLAAMRGSVLLLRDI
jgi:hypothetical protein